MKKGMIVTVIIGIILLVKIIASLKQVFKVFDNVSNLQKSSKTEHKQILDKIDLKSERVDDKLHNVNLGQRDIYNQVNNVKEQLDKAQNRIDSMNTNEAQVQVAIDTISNQLNQVYNQRRDKDLKIYELSEELESLKKEYNNLIRHYRSVYEEKQELEEQIKRLSPKRSYDYDNDGPSL